VSGKRGVALRGQPPHPFRTTDFARLVLEANQTLAMKLCEVLSHADFGDTEGVRESVRAQRTARFERVEKLIALVRAHDLALPIAIKKPIAFLTARL
jgi:hypothetical protein